MDLDIRVLDDLTKRRVTATFYVQQGILAILTYHFADLATAKMFVFEEYDRLYRDRCERHELTLDASIHDGKDVWTYDPVSEDFEFSTRKTGK